MAFYSGFDDSGELIMKLARDEARLSRHDYVDTGHFLLAILKVISLEPTSKIGAVFQRLGLIDFDSIKAEIRKESPPGSEEVSETNLPRTPSASQVIIYALEERGRRNAVLTSDQDILLGLLQEHEGLACIILERRGMTLEKARNALTSM